MTRPVLGVICGIVFGLISVGMMIPMELHDKRVAMRAAFFNRFGIGVAIGASSLGIPGWLNGVLFGVLLSLPAAIISRAWVPILTLGTIGGALIGVAVATWGA